MGRENVLTVLINAGIASLLASLTMPILHPTGGENPTVMLVGKEELEVRNRPIPTIGNDDVLIKVMVTGLWVTSPLLYQLRYRRIVLQARTYRQPCYPRQLGPGA